MLLPLHLNALNFPFVSGGYKAKRIIWRDWSQRKEDEWAEVEQTVAAQEILERVKIIFPEEIMAELDEDEEAILVLMLT